MLLWKQQQYIHLLHIIWASVSEPHTSAFNVEFSLYHMYVRTCIKLYVAASAASSVGHSYCAPLLPPRVPSASLNEYM